LKNDVAGQLTKREWRADFRESPLCVRRPPGAGAAGNL